MERFYGSWKFVSCDNFDDYLKGRKKYGGCFWMMTIVLHMQGCWLTIRFQRVSPLPNRRSCPPLCPYGSCHPGFYDDYKDAVDIFIRLWQRLQPLASLCLWEKWQYWSLPPSPSPKSQTVCSCFWSYLIKLFKIKVPFTLFRNMA